MHFLECKVLEEVVAQAIESSTKLLSHLDRIGMYQLPRGRFDDVEVVGHHPMIGLEFIDHGSECGIGSANLRKNRDVLARVMGMHEPAIVQAVDTELPQRATGLEFADFGSHVARWCSGEHLFAQLTHDSQVMPDQIMHPLQFGHEGLSGGGRWVTYGRFHVLPISLVRPSCAAV